MIILTNNYIFTTDITYDEILIIINIQIMQCEFYYI